ncbi:hypothetical protein ES703_21775 [subsurface metagenome]
MKGRLILAIISNSMEEVAIVVIVLWGLPKLNIHIPIWGLILMMVAWAAYSIFSFRLGTRALKSKQVVGLPDMIGCRGVVVSPLAPEGLVKVKGELWVAKSAGGEMKKGGGVIVVGQERLKLVVHESGGTDSLESTV